MAEQNTGTPEVEQKQTRVVIEMPAEAVERLLKLKKEADEKGEPFEIGGFRLLDIKPEESESK